MIIARVTLDVPPEGKRLPAINTSQAPFNAVYMTASQASSSDQSAIYRSVPANPREDSLYDLYTRTVLNVSPPPYSRNSRAPISSMEYAKRINSRPTTTPKVVGFDSGALCPQPMKRGVEGFFPCVKLSGSARSTTTVGSSKTSPPTPSTTIQSPVSLSFEIAPSPEMTAHYYRNKARKKSAKSNASLTNMSKIDKPLADVSSQSSPEMTDRCMRKYPYYTHTYPNVLQGEKKEVGGDLSYLPRPKNFVARRDVPWIYRYKVKKNMNQLSKIMARRSENLAEESVKT